MGKVIHWEMCKKFKWYMHNPAHILENDTHKLRLDFDIHIDHLISARRPNLIIINKKKRICKIVDFTLPGDHKIKLKECEKKDKYLDLAGEVKKIWSMKVTIIIFTNPSARARYDTRSIFKRILTGLNSEFSFS